MADISMCRNQACPSRSKCWRYNAPVNLYRQAYGHFNPELDEDACSFFWPMPKGVSRIDIIGQNGNDGEHYEEALLQCNKEKYDGGCG